jgi:hypothetical protein
MIKKKPIFNYFRLAGAGLITLLNPVQTVYAIDSKPIDRHSVVSRHNLLITDKNSKGPTQVGNGRFAFGFDITGLQTFNQNANTMSEWGWHQFPCTGNESPEQFRGQQWDTHGRMVRYDIQNEEQSKLVTWMRANPQRLNLGRIGFVLKTKDGKTMPLEQLRNPVQSLDLWTGIAVSNFEVDGKPVKVTTIGDPNSDAVSVKIEAPDLNDGRIAIRLAFPYASMQEFGNGADWNSPAKHQTITSIGRNSASFRRTLDDTQFNAGLQWSGSATLQKESEHVFLLKPHNNRHLEFTLSFARHTIDKNLASFKQTRSASVTHWQHFWETGGAIDLSGSKDPRWKELERRIVLSQYLMAVNEAGSMPPQESGLVNNGWYGKFHFEMIWWHAAHYALWNRFAAMDSMINIYLKDLEAYKPRTRQQGYEGVRWPKTLGDDKLWEWPNEINPLLIWQQPHPIFMAELEYRKNPVSAVLEKWKDVVSNTADFMASYAFYYPREKRYILGYPLQVVSENAQPRTTINPTFELSYWRTGLKLAQQWRKRLGLTPIAKYEKVLSQLSPLPKQDSTYVQWENIYGQWNIYNYEHPALIGAFGMLPGDGVDTATMERTLMKVNKKWQLNKTWGWDFPMLAMCAARLGHGDMAVNYLLDFPGFTLDEHGLVDGGGPYPYFPGNGGLLYAVAMMTAGWDGSKGPQPGFPKDGSWVVRYENLNSAL